MARRLMVYFTLRGAHRVYGGFTDENERFGAVGDFVLLLVMGLLVAGLDRTLRGLHDAVGAATARAEEYKRACATSAGSRATGSRTRSP